MKERTVGDRLQKGESLKRGQSLTSRNGAYTLTLQDDGNLVLNKSFQDLFGSTPGVAFGNRYANQLPYLSEVATFGKFDKMKIILCGSGGIDNIEYTVPEPATMTVMGIGGILALVRRKRK